MKDTSTESRKAALSSILKTLVNRSAKAVSYTAAFLGILALIPNIQFPPELAVLMGGLSVDAMGSLLDRVAFGEKMAEEEIVQRVESVIADSKIDKMLTKDTFFHAYSHLLKKHRILENSSKEILLTLENIDKIITSESSTAITYSDARQIAQDVFDANFFRLSADAQELVKSRVKEFNENLLSGLSASNVNAFNAAGEPDFQYNLFESQKTYVRSGNTETKDLLIELLVAKATSSRDSLLGVSQNEAINIIPKLIPAHFDTLSLIFVVKYLKVFPQETIDSYIRNFNKHIKPLIGHLPSSEKFYRYLEEVGCVFFTKNIYQGEYKLDKSLGSQFNKDELAFLIDGGAIIPELFESSKEEKEIFQLIHKLGWQPPSEGGPGGERRIFLEKDEIRKKLETNGFSGEKLEKLVKEYSRYSYSQNSHRIIEDFIRSSAPTIETLHGFWHFIMKYDLTSAGLVIALSNLKRHTGEVYNIHKWIGG